MKHRTHPKALLNSKWTAVKPANKQKHFVVIEVEFNDDALVVKCVIEAVMTHNTFEIDWRELNDRSIWRSGWV